MRLPARPLSSAGAARGWAPRTGTTARRFGTRFVYVQRSTVEIGAIQTGNGRFGSCVIAHFDERETAGLARVPVRHDIHSFDAAVSGESCMKIILGSLETEISDKYVCHRMNSFFSDLSLSDCSRPNL